MGLGGELGVVTSVGVTRGISLFTICLPRSWPYQITASRAWLGKDERPKNHDADLPLPASRQGFIQSIHDINPGDGKKFSGGTDSAAWFLMLRRSDNLLRVAVTKPAQTSGRASTRERRRHAALIL